MDRSLQEMFRNKIPLERQTVAKTSKKCKICGCASVFFDVVDMNKFCTSEGDFYKFGPSNINAQYFKCTFCDFFFTDFFDNWTESDWAEWIYNEDYIIVDPEYKKARPEKTAQSIAKLLEDRKRQKILDYGSGAGVFAENLRMLGFESVSEYDPFSNPHRPSGLFDVITCFEVIEHSPNPRELLADICSFLAPGGMLIISTGIQPPNFQQLRGSWWYVGPRNGHVSIFSQYARAYLMQSFGLYQFGADPSIIFSRVTQDAAVRDIEQRFGAANAFLQLRAPATQSEGPDKQWHGIEGTIPDRVRWSAASVLTWEIPEMRAGMQFHVSMPYAIEIEDNFASRAIFVLGDQRNIASVDKKTIKTTFTITDSSVRTLEIHFPKLRCPREMRGAADDRFLGIAVPLA